MKRILFSCLFFLASFFVLPNSIQAQTDFSQRYSTGTVHEIIEETEIQREESPGYIQRVLVRDEASNTDHEVLVGSEQIPLSRAQTYQVGQKVVLVSQHRLDGTPEYLIADQYRSPTLFLLLAGFVLIVLLVSRLKGLLSLIGMVLSAVVLLAFMVPQIVSGANPVFISIISAGLISCVMIYLAHGWNFRSHISLFCMLATLTLVGVLSHFVVELAYLGGIGDESASFLQFSGFQSINLRGLFLGGIILAALSVLDDSVVSQVSIVYQLKKVKEHISFKELFSRGMEVGKDHISSLVNTLFLAYAGASLPLFILLTQNNIQPVWVSLNDQMIAEEIVRTLTGSIGLVLSIPLTTLITAYVMDKKKLIS